MAWKSGEDGFLEKMLGPLPGQPAPAVRWVGDPVRTHLALLLNTRQGAIQNLPDYGLPDVSSFYSEYPASLSQLRTLIERLIRKYEPRLLNARVHRLEDYGTKEFRASFLVTGEVEEGEGPPARVRYKTVITGAGHAAVAADEDL